MAGFYWKWPNKTRIYSTISMVKTIMTLYPNPAIFKEFGRINLINKNYDIL